MQYVIQRLRSQPMEIGLDLYIECRKIILKAFSNKAVRFLFLTISKGAVTPRNGDNFYCTVS